MYVRGGYIYIMSNKARTVLYIEITSNLFSRVYEHKNEEGSVFTKKYNCTDLIYYECFDYIEEAITREKQLKKWKRSWKDRLIKKMNPILRDLSDEIADFT